MIITSEYYFLDSGRRNNYHGDPGFQFYYFVLKLESKYLFSVDKDTKSMLLALCTTMHAILASFFFSFFFFFFFHHFYFPTQLVGGFTLSDLMYKPWSQVSPNPPGPGTCLHFFRAEGSAFPLLVGFHRMLLTHALSLPANQFLMQEKVPTSVCTR